MSNALVKGQQKQQKQQKEDILQNIVNEDSFNALNSAIDVVKKEYGNFMLTNEMRRELAKELGVSEECADGWQRVVDVLDHIDINALAKKHPEAIGKISKTIMGIILSIFPIAAPAKAIAGIAPEDFLAKVVEFAGILTPEHLVKIFAQKQVEKNKAKREQAKNAGIEQPSKFSEFKGKLSAGYKNTTDKISGLFAKKTSTTDLPQDEDIFDSIRKLSELKDNGIITQDEFDVKKAELLERL